MNEYNEKIKNQRNRLNEFFSTEISLCKSAEEMHNALNESLTIYEKQNPLHREIIESYRIISENPYKDLYKSIGFGDEQMSLFKCNDGSWKTKEELNEEDISYILQQVAQKFQSDEEFNKRLAAECFIQIYSDTRNNKTLELTQDITTKAENDQNFDLYNAIVRNRLSPVQRHAREEVLLNDFAKDSQYFENEQVKSEISSSIESIQSRITPLMQEVPSSLCERLRKKSSSFIYSNEWLQEYIKEPRSRNEEKFLLEEFKLYTNAYKEKLLSEISGDMSLRHFLVRSWNTNQPVENTYFQRDSVQKVFDQWIELNIDPFDKNNKPLGKLSPLQNPKLEQKIYNAFIKYRSVCEIEAQLLKENPQVDELKETYQKNQSIFDKFLSSIKNAAVNLCIWLGLQKAGPEYRSAAYHKKAKELLKALEVETRINSDFVFVEKDAHQDAHQNDQQPFRFGFSQELNKEKDQIHEFDNNDLYIDELFEDLSDNIELIK